MRLFLAGGALLLLAGACSAPKSPTSEAEVLMRSSFEENLGWNDVNPALFSTEQAHGGRVSAVVSPQVEFGSTFARTLSQLGLGNGAHHLELSGWVLRPTPGSNAQLVVQVDASATSQAKVYYATLPLAEAAPVLGDWVQVTLPVELPATAEGGNRLKVYLWNEKATAPTYLDDVVLRRASAPAGK